MKTIKLFFIFFLISSAAQSQIPTLKGIYDIDSCKFEKQYAFIKIDTASQNVWQIGKPSKLFFDSAYSPTNAILTDTINSYPVSNHSYFDLIIANRFLMFDQVVSFKHKFQTDNLIDGGYIEVSYDSGATWKNVINDKNPKLFFADNLYSSKDTLKGGINGFSGTSNGWVYTRIEWIWQLVMKTGPGALILRFNFNSDSVHTNKAGWMIDDIVISWVDQGSGVEEINSSKNNLIISPNPSNGMFDISSSTVISRIEVFDIIGNKVFSSSANATLYQIDLSYLIKGIYFVKCNSENSVICRKIVIE